MISSRTPENWLSIIIEFKWILLEMDSFFGGRLTIVPAMAKKQHRAGPCTCHTSPLATKHEGFHKWWYHNSWMVCNGKSYFSMDENWGYPHDLGNLHIKPACCCRTGHTSEIDPGFSCPRLRWQCFKPSLKINLSFHPLTHVEMWAAHFSGCLKTGKRNKHHSMAEKTSFSSRTL